MMGHVRDFAEQVAVQWGPVDSLSFAVAGASIGADKNVPVTNRAWLASAFIVSCLLCLLRSSERFCT
jgi:hypothetical protein